MIVPFMDGKTGTAVYINLAYVVTLRPDPVDLDRISVVKLEDGETIRVLGEHREVADKLAREPEADRAGHGLRASIRREGWNEMNSDRLEWWRYSRGAQRSVNMRSRSIRFPPGLPAVRSA